MYSFNIFVEYLQKNMETPQLKYRREAYPKDKRIELRQSCKEDKNLCFLLTKNEKAFFLTCGAWII
ncbi:hypothetical protein bsdcttw_32910 [Anaerocolumna chitinilytica]|uniref:Uncharacterized protein n=1 Tax=Anaerocolumna chitinilytica TaxID=1727145 RepID=A0A7I8DPB9_9FIRM|nr:hypothetical protein bsdcttw_32910 [Anaerocolumna chitinilytica]